MFGMQHHSRETYYLKQLQLCPRESNGVSEIANDEIHHARAEVALYAHSTIRDAILYLIRNSAIHVQEFDTCIAILFCALMANNVRQTKRNVSTLVHLILADILTRIKFWMRDFAKEISFSLSVSLSFSMS